MTIKEELMKKVPADIQQTPEYKVLLAAVKKEKISTTHELKAYITAEIKRCREIIKKSQGANPCGTMRRVLASTTKKLDWLEVINKKVLKYL